jgi:hypothetical protein
MIRLTCIVSTIAVFIALVLGLQAVADGGGHDKQAAGDKHDMTKGTMTHAVYRPDDVRWHDGPASLPRGMQYAVLKGNPAEPGPFTMRLRVPADYEIPPHWHPSTENITVISGEFNLGMGDTFDPGNAEAMPAGTYAFMTPGMRHFAFTEKETVIQLHGIGPWEIHYLDRADDPRVSPGQ